MQGLGWMSTNHEMKHAEIREKGKKSTNTNATHSIDHTGKEMPERLQGMAPLQPGILMARTPLLLISQAASMPFE